MVPNDVFERLIQFGYSRFEESNETIQRSVSEPSFKTRYNESFEGKIINHSIMENMTIHKCNFEKAAATGSIFRSCHFIDCDMYGADFQFCEFYDCMFQCSIIPGVSFNSSNFINTRFIGTHFESCTFTNAYFEDCQFDRNQITLSSLEGALYKNCEFRDVDYRNLNMDFIEIDAPRMENAVLPLDQIPFMYGALQYLRYTKDSVYISEGPYRKMTPKSYFSNVIPLMCIHFEKTKQFFPLANIYFAIGNKDCAHKAIQNGLVTSMAAKDFRMLKHYCKLIAFSGVYQSSTLHGLYNNYICRLFPQQSYAASMPNYARHLMEIKNLLFSTAQRASIQVSMKTNIQLSENQKLGKLFESIFSLCKFKGFFCDNDIEAVLRQNSPLVISVTVSGAETQLCNVLQTLLILCGIRMEEQTRLPAVAEFCHLLQASNIVGEELLALANKFREELVAYEIQINILEYYISNFHIHDAMNENYYYFNSNALMLEESPQ